MTRTYKADYAAVATALGLDPDVEAATALAAVAALKAMPVTENERNTERARADGLADKLATVRVELLKRRDRVRAVGANQAFADMTAVADMINV